MVGKNVIAAAAVYFALGSALALPKEPVDNHKGKHDGNDNGLTRLPLKTDDKDCSSKIPKPTGVSTDDHGTVVTSATILPTVVTLTTEDDPRSTDDSSLTPVGVASTATSSDDSSATTSATSGDDDSVTSSEYRSATASANAAVVTKRAAQPDKGKDDPSRTTSSPSLVATAVETSDDNPDASATANSVVGGVNDYRGLCTVTMTTTEAPTLTVTLTISTSVSSSPTTSRSRSRESKTSTTTSPTTSSTTSYSSRIDDNPHPETTGQTPPPPFRSALSMRGPCICTHSHDREQVSHTQLASIVTTYWKSLGRETRRVFLEHSFSMKEG